MHYGINSFVIHQKQILRALQGIADERSLVASFKAPVRKGVQIFDADGLRDITHKSLYSIESISDRCYEILHLNVPTRIVKIMHGNTSDMKH